MNTNTPPRAINPRPNMNRRQSESYWAKKWKAEVMEKRRLAAELEHQKQRTQYWTEQFYEVSDHHLPIWKIIIKRIKKHFGREF